MAFIDDDEEEDSVPQSASNYYFEDDDKAPVSFVSLPIQWSEKEKVDGNGAGFYLRGTSDDGLLPLHKLVKAWRFDLSNFRPEISVLTKDNVWIKLEKARKSYAELIRTVLVTVHSLQFLGRNPQASDKSLWEHLSRIFKAYDVKPSQRYAPHFDEMNFQRMSSFPPQAPMQPSGHNFYDPPGFPWQPPPPPEDFRMNPMGFAPGPNYPYISRSGGWLND